MRKETRCCHIGYSFRLATRVLLYAPSHRQDNTYHGLCYTSRGALAGTSMKDRSDDPSHHERTLLPRSYISLPGCMGVSTCTRPPISSESRLARARERPGGVGAHGVRAAIMRAVRTLVHIWIKERNVVFNDALNTFYLRLYGVRHMVKDHSDSEKGNPLLPHRLLLSINSKGSFICTIPHTG